jgi:hypothetical protein
LSFTSQKTALDIGPLRVEKAEHHSIPVPPLLAVAGILCGGALVYFGAGQSR